MSAVRSAPAPAFPTLVKFYYNGDKHEGVITNIEFNDDIFSHTKVYIQTTTADDIQLLYQDIVSDISLRDLLKHFKYPDNHMENVIEKKTYIKYAGKDKPNDKVHIKFRHLPNGGIDVDTGFYEDVEVVNDEPYMSFRVGMYGGCEITRTFTHMFKHYKHVIPKGDTAYIFEKSKSLLNIAHYMKIPITELVEKELTYYDVWNYDNIIRMGSNDELHERAYEWLKKQIDIEKNSDNLPNYCEFCETFVSEYNWTGRKCRLCKEEEDEDMEVCEICEKELYDENDMNARHECGCKILCRECTIKHDRNCDTFRKSFSVLSEWSAYEPINKNEKIKYFLCKRIKKEDVKVGMIILREHHSETDTCVRKYRVKRINKKTFTLEKLKWNGDLYHTPEQIKNGWPNDELIQQQELDEYLETY